MEEGFPNSCINLEEDGDVVERMEVLEENQTQIIYIPYVDAPYGNHEGKFIYQGDLDMDQDKVGWVIGRIEGFVEKVWLDKYTFVLLFGREPDMLGLRADTHLCRFILTEDDFTVVHHKSYLKDKIYTVGNLYNYDYNRLLTPLTLNEVARSVREQNTMLIYSKRPIRFADKYEVPYIFGYLKKRIDNVKENVYDGVFDSLFKKKEYQIRGLLCSIDVLDLLYDKQKWLKEYIEFSLLPFDRHNWNDIFFSFIEYKGVQEKYKPYLKQFQLDFQLIPIYPLGCSLIQKQHRCKTFDWQCGDCLFKQVFFRCFRVAKEYVRIDYLEFDTHVYLSYLFYGMKTVMTQAKLYLPGEFMMDAEMSRYYMLYIDIIRVVVQLIMEEFSDRITEKVSFDRVHSLKNLCTSKLTRGSNQMLYEEYILRDKNFEDLGLRELCLGIRRFFELRMGAFG